MTLQSVLEDIQKRPGTGDVIPIIDPVSEEQIGEFIDFGPEIVNEAVATAKSCAEFFRYYAGWCSKIKINGTAYDIRTTGIATDSYVDQHGYTPREPYGVVGLIFP
jgi:aldehyde dehydrogenase (NAD+)